MQKVSPPRPPPPRRTPPVAAPIAREVSTDSYIASHIRFELGGVAAISRNLSKQKDLLNDIKVALAVAEDSLKAIANNRLVRLPAPRDGSTTDGLDVQCLTFALTTRTKIDAEEKKQDAFYAKLPEMPLVAAELAKASKDSELRRYKEQMNCYIADSSIAGWPQSPLRDRSLSVAQRQILLNPFSINGRQSLCETPNLSARQDASSRTVGSSPATSTSPYRGKLSQRTTPHLGASHPSSVTTQENTASLSPTAAAVLPPQHGVAAGATYPSQAPGYYQQQGWSRPVQQPQGTQVHYNAL